MRTFALVLGLLAVLPSTPTAFANQVTFQVNLSAQIALGNFDPASDALYVAGDPLNGWSTVDSPLAPSAADPNLWTGAFEVTGTPGSTVQYKFLMTTASGTAWEGNVGTGGTTGNRAFTLADGDQTLPVVYFNNVSTGVSVSSDVAFQVNLSVQIALGAFDPESGTVTVAGEFNSWNASDFTLSRSTTNPDLWVGTRKLTGALNSSVSYKFVLNGSTWEGNVGLNGAQNRALTLTSGAQTLPVVFFSNVTAVPVNIPLTFQVNLGVAIAQGSFDPANGTVSVAGDLLNSWSASASALERSASDPNVWKGTFEVNSQAGAVLLFKYVLNGSTWEGNVGPDGTQNRSYTLASAQAQSPPMSYFNNVDNLGTLGRSAVTGGQVTLTWAPGPLIRLQTNTGLNGKPWQDVPNTLGQGTATVAVGSGHAFFRLVGP